MRVIEHGEKEKQTKCGNCKSVIGYRSSDEKIQKRAYGTILVERTTLTCPICENRIITSQFEDEETLKEREREVREYLESLEEMCEPNCEPEPELESELDRIVKKHPMIFGLAIFLFILTLAFLLSA